MSKKNSLISTTPTDLLSSIPHTTRSGIFEQGFDKLGRPYEKKLDTNGLYTKTEVLKDGTQKLTIKKKS